MRPVHEGFTLGGQGFGLPLAGAAMLGAPMRIGPFVIAENGMLQLRAPAVEPVFSFMWRKTCFTVRVSEGAIALRAPAGRIPSTADGPGRRERALAAVRALPSCLPADLRLCLLPDHRVQLDMRAELGWPTSASGLMAPIVGMLLRLAPVLDVMAEAGLVTR
jgi:hypothetical protein